MRVGMLALLVCGLWLAWLPPHAYAQEATPTPPLSGQSSGPSLPSFPSASDIANALIGPLRQALTDWWQQARDQFGTTVNDTISEAFDAFGAFLSDLLHRVNFVTELPPGMTYQLPAVQQLRGRLETLAWASWPVVVLANLLWAGYGTLVSYPASRLAQGAGRSIVAYTALHFVGGAQVWWIDFCNSLANSILSFEGGLPAMHSVTGLGHAAVELFAAGLYYLFTLILFVGRAGTLGWVDLLLVWTPMALMLWALPFGLAQRFGRFWCDQFLLSVFVQVLIAVVMALAAGLVTTAATLGMGGIEQVFTTILLLGGLFWLAFSLPGKLTRSLEHSPTQVFVQLGRVAGALVAK